MRKPTFFDFLAGIGGFRIALERLGWRCVGWCEIDKFCQRTYRANFDCDGEFFWEDAKTIPIERIPNFDVLCSGFPCQPFSVSGRRRGFEDARGTLFFEICKVLEGKKPRAFILENVKGLVCKPFRGREFKFMIRVLSELGYTVFWKVLNSKDFGVPQNRERVYIVGFKKWEPLSAMFVFPTPQPLKLSLRDVLEESVSPKYFLSPKMVNYLLAHSERHKLMGHGFGFRIANVLANTITARYYKDGAENLVRVSQAGLAQTDRVYSPLGLSPCLVTPSGGRHIPQIFVRGGVRRLTPRECARLQGFPDTFKIVVSDTQAYKQFGNAVTVTVVEALGRAMEPWLTR